MNTIFETLNDDEMEQYLAEEVKMQDIIEKQEKTTTIEDSAFYMDQYYDLVLNSKFRAIRKKIMFIEKNYYDNTIYSLIKKFNKA
jgi:hypothetical protein